MRQQKGTRENGIELHLPHVQGYLPPRYLLPVAVLKKGSPQLVGAKSPEISSWDELLESSRITKNSALGLFGDIFLGLSVESDSTDLEEGGDLILHDTGDNHKVRLYLSPFADKSKRGQISTPFALKKAAALWGKRSIVKRRTDPGNGRSGGWYYLRLQKKN